MTPQELFATLESRYRLPQGYLNRVYQLESGGGKNNYNPLSGATGPFQFMPGTAKGMGLTDPNDLAQSAEATARLAVQNRDYLMKRGVENVDGGTLYLAHAQGPAGAYALMTNPDKKAVDALSPLYKDQSVAEKAVTQNAGKVDQDAGSFAQQFVNKYEGKAAQAKVQPYSALGETAAKTEEPSTDEGITTLAKVSAEEAAPERGSSRREMYALNTLMGLTKELEQKPAPMLPIPRLSFAKGGIVSLVDGPEQPKPRGINVSQTTAEVVKEIQGIAEKGNLDEYKIAFLLRMAATNTIPPDRALAFAKEILAGDVQALMERFRRYPRALRMLARLDLSLGGLAGQGYGLVANQYIRTKPQGFRRVNNAPMKDTGFADGGEVGGHNEMAMFDLAQFAVKIYGPERANNMIRRSEGDPNKLYFALNQYAKNVVGPQSPNYALNLKALQVIAARHKLRPTNVFNRTEDAISTEQELDKIIKDVPKKDRVFRDALVRMKAMIGWKPKPKMVRS